MTRYLRRKGYTKWSIIMGVTCGVLLFLEIAIVRLLAAEVLTIGTSQNCGCSPLPLSVEVTVGEHWLHVSKLFFLEIRTAPQLVIWGEDRRGRFLETLFITRKMGQQRWGQGEDPTQVLYWEALPYWMFNRHECGYAFPTQQQPMPDALTGATPKADFRIPTCIDLEQPDIQVFLEVNMSLDFNEVYSITAQEGTENYNKRSGQPALIYRAEVDLEQPGRYEMSLIGHAHPSGDNGQLFTDLSGITTALQIIKQAVVIVGAANEIKGKG